MRGHDHTSRGVRSRAALGVILAVALLAAGGGARRASGQISAAPAEGASVPAIAALAHAREPVTLAGQHVVTWTLGAQQWVLLSGRVAALQETEGLRADEGVARIVSSPIPGGTSYRIDVYTEKRGGDDPAGPQTTEVSRRTFETRSRVELKRYGGSALVVWSGPPRDSTLLARSGLAAAAVRKPTAPASPSPPTKPPEPVAPPSVVVLPDQLPVPTA